MDNQQETLKVNLFELGWFAGFVDGEGAVGITKRNRMKRDKTPFITYKPHLIITNTEYILIERMMYILDKMDVPYHISEKVENSKSNRKTYWILSIDGQNRVMKVLPWLTPYLQSCKRHKAGLVMKYCNSRKAHSRSKDGYTKEELDIITLLYQLNLRGNTSTIKDPQRLHARQVSTPEDIVRT